LDPTGSRSRNQAVCRQAPVQVLAGQAKSDDLGKFQAHVILLHFSLFITLDSTGDQPPGVIDPTAMKLKITVSRQTWMIQGQKKPRVSSMLFPSSQPMNVARITPITP
jgi:hypothetical protein